MKAQIYALSALALVGLAPQAATAADLGGDDRGYEERGAVVEGPPVRRYYDEGPVVAYDGPRYYRPYYPYYAGYYPYRWGPRYWYGRGYGGRGYWGHRGWR